MREITLGKELYQDYDYQVYAVKMHDGVHLETHVILPKSRETQTWPILLTRTPYEGMKAYNHEVSIAFAKVGIGVVYQFCRGISGSEGSFVPNLDEPMDGKYTLDWLNNQTWCKQIGLYGSSYMALTSWVVADMLTDKVAGMFVSHYGVDRHKSAYQAGLFRHDILTGWALGNSGNSNLNKENFKELYMAAAKYRPHIEADKKIWGKALPWYREWISEPDYDAHYWQSGFWSDLKTKPGKTNVPVCILAGWFDHHLEGTILSYKLLNEKVKPFSKLVVGSWNHSFIMTTGGYSCENGTIDIHKEMYTWFDSLFKDGPTYQESKVYYIGKDQWIETEDIETLADDSLTLYLDSKQALVENKETFHHVYEYDYNPEDPVMSIGGETLFVSEDIRGSVEQVENSEREDIIRFETQKLPETLNISGEIVVDLTVESDCEDTCFTIKLIDVFEDGKAYNIRNQVTTLAYRNSSSHRLIYEANTKIGIQLKALPITWQLKEGHRLKLEISSSNFPEYSAHANKPGVWSEINDTQIAHQKVYVGGNYPSCITIPIRKDV